MKFVSRSTLLTLVFWGPHLLDSKPELNVRQLLMHYAKEGIDDKTTQIQFDKEEPKLSLESRFDPKMGITPHHALKALFKHLEKKYSPAEQLLFFEELESLQIVRCGKTALVLRFKNSRRYTAIFDAKAQLIYQAVDREVA